MKIYKRKNKSVVKKELVICIEDEIQDQIELQQMEDDLFSYDDFYLDYNELFDNI